MTITEVKTVLGTREREEVGLASLVSDSQFLTKKSLTVGMRT